MTNKNAYVASCAGKQTYPTKAAAHIAIQRMQKQRHRFGKTKVYRCQYCTGVHISRIKRTGELKQS